MLQFFAKKINKIRDSIGVYVKSHKNLKMVGDLTFRSPDFRIKKIKKKNKNKKKETKK